MKALIISPLLFKRDYPEWERRTETSFGFKTLISWKYTQHTNVLNVTSGDSSNMKKKSSLCLYTYEWSNISLYCLVQQQQKKKSDWKVTEIAEARHMKENADKHITLLVFYLVLGIFSWPNDAKKKLNSEHSELLSIFFRYLFKNSDAEAFQCQPHAAPCIAMLQIISIL